MTGEEMKKPERRVGSFGVDISLPTGFLARILSLGNEGVRDFLCNVVDHIDIKTPDNFPIAVGLVPMEDSCNEDFCPTKHALYLGTRPCKKQTPFRMEKDMVY